MRKIALVAFLAVALTGLAGCTAMDDPDTRPQRSEVYTRAEAETTMGHTLVGEVVSFTDDAVTVRTATGNETVQLGPDTQGREMLRVGERIAVDFQRGSAQGVLIATNIRQPTEAADPEPNR